MLDNYRKLGYQYPTYMLVDMVIDASKLPKWSEKEEISKAMEEVEKYNEIGKNAMIGKSRKFSISFAVKDFKEEVTGYKSALDHGWLSKEEYKKLYKEADERHEKTIRIELSKKPKKRANELKKNRHPSKEESEKIKKRNIKPKVKVARKYECFGNWEQESDKCLHCNINWNCCKRTKKTRGVKNENNN